MERDDGKIRWRKDGGGSLRLKIGYKGGRNKYRIIKPGEVFHARPDEIPKAFRDVVIPLDGLPEEVTPENVVKTTYTPVHRGGGRYNVVDGNDKVVNDGYLTKEGAQKLVNDLS